MEIAIKDCVLGETPDILDRVPIQPAAVAASLADFGISLGLRQLEQIASYMDLLTRWNRAINLTAILDPGEVITRHFAESIYVTRFVDLQGEILDVGSGAGFPGLAIKIARPELRVVLLEPVAKKRAFLKEVVRECKLDKVEVSGSRVEDYCTQALGGFESATVRAVGNLPMILPATARCLKRSGSIYLWLAGDEGPQYALEDSGYSELFRWLEPTPLPMSRDRKIWRGRLVADR
jgi:16S rRNA (guanine(527)-N(7))-methyltransferase RsmG